MEKLIHKANGELVVDNPFKVVGTKLRYRIKGSRGGWREGIVTEAAIRRYTDKTFDTLNRTRNPVWARWGSMSTPAYVSTDEYDVEVV